MFSKYKGLTANFSILLLPRLRSAREFGTIQAHLPREYGVNRLNRKTDYAVRVLLALAKRPPGERVPTARISQEMLIPAALSGRIVADLARGGLVRTFPGRDGGVQLARPAEEITLLQVVTLMEGPFHLSECVEGNVTCPFEAHCPVRRQWIRVDDMVAAALNRVTFADLAQEAETA